MQKRTPRKPAFDVQRRKAFCRAKCQADFRGEVWHLTWEDWCAFWSTEEVWHQRGRSTDALCLTRLDYKQPWSKTNCCLLPRRNALAITNRRNTDLPTDHLWSQAIYRD